MLEQMASCMRHCLQDYLYVCPLQVAVDDPMDTLPGWLRNTEARSNVFHAHSTSKRALYVEPKYSRIMRSPLSIRVRLRSIRDDHSLQSFSAYLGSFFASQIHSHRVSRLSYHLVAFRFYATAHSCPRSLSEGRDWLSIGQSLGLRV